MGDTAANTDPTPDWVVVFTDGVAVAGSTVDEWLAAPSRGVAAVIVPHEYSVREILTGEHYLLAAGNRYPQASDVWGVLDHLLEIGETNPETRPSDVSIADLAAAGVKLGRNLDSDRWRRLFDQIVEIADGVFGVDAGGTSRVRPR